MRMEYDHHLRPRLSWERLSPREKEVALWTIRGYSVREVASILHISQRTVKVHASSIYSTLNIETRSELAYYGMRDRFCTDVSIEQHHLPFG